MGLRPGSASIWAGAWCSLDCPRRDVAVHTPVPPDPAPPVGPGLHRVGDPLPRVLDGRVCGGRMRVLAVALRASSSGRSWPPPTVWVRASPPETELTRQMADGTRLEPSHHRRGVPSRKAAERSRPGRTPSPGCSRSSTAPSGTWAWCRRRSTARRPSTVDSVGGPPTGTGFGYRLRRCRRSAWRTGGVRVTADERPARHPPARRPAVRRAAVSQSDQPRGARPRRPPRLSAGRAGTRAQFSRVVTIAAAAAVGTPADGDAGVGRLAPVRVTRSASALGSATGLDGSVATSSLSLVSVDRPWARPSFDGEGVPRRDP